MSKAELINTGLLPGARVSPNDPIAQTIQYELDKFETAFDIEDLFQRKPDYHVAFCEGVAYIKTPSQGIMSVTGYIKWMQERLVWLNVQHKQLVQDNHRLKQMIPGTKLGEGILWLRKKTSTLRSHSMRWSLRFKRSKWTKLLKLK